MLTIKEQERAERIAGRGPAIMRRRKATADERLAQEESVFEYLLDKFTLRQSEDEKILIGFQLLPYIRPRLRSVDLKTIHNVDVDVTIGGEAANLNDMRQANMLEVLDAEIAGE